MKLQNILLALKKEEDGSIMIIVALFMTVLIGLSALVLDLGIAYNIKSELQKDLDSIALAAVRELPADNTSSLKWSNAKAAAHKYAQLNGVTNLVDSDILPVYESSKIIGVKIKGNANVNYNFARVLGYNSEVINNSATAKLKAVSGMSGLLPLALPKGIVDIITAESLVGDVTLKLGPQKIDGVEDMRLDFAAIFDALGGNTGWRGAINFVNGGNDGNYKTTMESGGYDGMVNIGDPVALNSGNMPVNITNIINVNDEVVIPVVDLSGGVLKVVGFATFKITNLEGNNENSVKVSILTSSYISSNVVSGETESGVVINDYGVRAAKLVD